MAAPGATRATKYERMDGFEDGRREPKRDAREPDQPVTAFEHVSVHSAKLTDLAIPMRCVDDAASA